MPQAILIDSDILIDFSRGVKETAEYLVSTSAITTLTISTITQMELIVGCRDAATALELSYPFLTKNQRDFRFIPGLTLLPPP